LAATNFSFVFEAGIEIGEGTSPDPDPDLERVARASNDVDSEPDGDRGPEDEGLMADMEFGGGVGGVI